MLKKLTGRKKNRISSSDAELLRKKISKEVDRWMIDNGYMYRCADGTYKPKRGSCYARWEYEKKLLKERYGIDWQHPGETDTGTIFD